MAAAILPNPSNSRHPGKRTHGHTRGCEVTPEYRCWAAMRHRCRNPNNRSYAILAYLRRIAS